MSISYQEQLTRLVANHEALLLEMEHLQSDIDLVTELLQNVLFDESVRDAIYNACTRKVTRSGEILEDLMLSKELIAAVEVFTKVQGMSETIH